MCGGPSRIFSGKDKLMVTSITTISVFDHVVGLRVVVSLGLMAVWRSVSGESVWKSFVLRVDGDPSSPKSEFFLIPVTTTTCFSAVQ